MTNTDFTTTITVDNTPAEVFNAINNVRGWWSEEIAGDTEKQDDEFAYHFKEVHKCRMRLTEVIPNKKVVWVVMDNYFEFAKDQNEWPGTSISFEILKAGNKTQVRFTHHGLTRAWECFNICHKAWGSYIEKSLYNLITTGKGQPNPKEF